MMPISRRYAGTSVMRWPSMAISPLSGIKKPPTRLRGLAAAGRPEQRHQLAAADQQRHVIERGDLAETFGHSVELDRDIRATVRPRRGRRGRSGKPAFSGD